MCRRTPLWWIHRAQRLLKSEDLQLNVQNISKKYVNVYVKNEAFLFVLCVSFEEHQTHDVHGHFGKLKKQEPCLTKRFTRFRKSPSSKYQEIAAYIPVQNAYLNGENLHRETDTIIQKMKSDLQK